MIGYSQSYKLDSNSNSKWWYLSDELIIWLLKMQFVFCYTMFQLWCLVSFSMAILVYTLLFSCSVHTNTYLKLFFTKFGFSNILVRNIDLTISYFSGTPKLSYPSLWFPIFFYKNLNLFVWLPNGSGITWSTHVPAGTYQHLHHHFCSRLSAIFDCGEFATQLIGL